MGRIAEFACKGWSMTRGLRCSFCGLHADDVARLVAGASAYICDECVAKCVVVLEQNGEPARAAQTGDVR